jgi:hypothetical protein
MVYSSVLAEFSVPTPDGSSGCRVLRKRNIDLLYPAVVTAVWEYRSIVVLLGAIVGCTV